MLKLIGFKKSSAFTPTIKGINLPIHLIVITLNEITNLKKGDSPNPTLGESVGLRSDTQDNSTIESLLILRFEQTQQLD